jgi:sulfide-dependent adenosine diphosphate thiazole synthase
MILFEPDPVSTGEGMNRHYTSLKFFSNNPIISGSVYKVFKGRFCVEQQIEQTITKGILDRYWEKLTQCLNVDTAIVGAGPSGLIAACYLAEAGKKCAIFESKLAPGGGMWGGAMVFSSIVIQKEALPILDYLGIAYRDYNDELVTADSVETTAALIHRACERGAFIFNGITVEDVMMNDKGSRINGLVINWNSVNRLAMHVDPLTIMARTILDATGHPSEVCRTAARKNNITLGTLSGGIEGEMSLNARQGERLTVENTGSPFPGLYVSGMAANGIHGGFRMGPIFGGMIMSGKKVAEQIIQELEG